MRQRLQIELGEKYHEPIPAATADQLKRGAELYPQVCAACHGGRGDGQGKITEALVDTPTSFTDPQQATFFSDQARLHIIRKGIAGTPMMGWSGVLSDDDILALYLYVRSLIEKE
ncbi:MAG: c-type cytochrome [bacterium]